MKGKKLQCWKGNRGKRVDSKSKQSKRSFHCQRKEFGDALSSVQKKTTDTDFKSWLELPEQKELMVLVDQMTKIQIAEPDVRWKAEDVVALKDILSMLIASLKKEVEHAPPSTKELIDDRDFVQKCSTVPEIHDLQTDIARVQSLIDVLEKSEKLVI